MTFYNINPGDENKEIVADSVGVRDPVTDPDNIENKNGIFPFKSDNEFGTIIRISNKDDPNPGEEGHWIRDLKFTSDGKIWSRQRINTGEWTEWELVHPLMASINKTFIKDISVSGRTLTVIWGDGNKTTFTTQDTDTVTKVKGSQESTYRTGNVDITADGVGAVPITGGNVTGVLTVRGNDQYNSAQVRNVSMSTSEPSGGINGQIHFTYT